MFAVSRALCRSFLLVAIVGGSLVVSATADARKKPDYNQLLMSAEAEVMAGRIEPALARFNEAAKSDPTRKEAWVRSAQLEFDAGNYGRAIVAAEEVLKRDSTDLVADSVLTLGGLRVASQSLQRLRSSGALKTSDSARKEAEKLADTMRATLGNDILMSDEQRRDTAAANAAARRRASADAAARSRARRNAASAAATSANNGGALPALNNLAAPAAPAVSTAPAATTPAAPSKAAKANPFGVLSGH